MSLILRKFDSMTAWIDAAEKNAKPTFQSHTSDREWGGGLTFAGAIALARKGWHEERQQVLAILDPVRERLAEIIDFSQEPSYDMFGAEPDIDRYLSGELECMLENMPTLAPTKGKAMTLVVDACITGNVPAEEVFRRGAAIIALVETMTMLGFELEVWADMSVEGADRWTGLVRVHRAGENLDMGKVVFGIGHPAMLRRLCFGVMEGETAEVRKAFGFTEHGGYGSPCGIHESAEMVDASFTLSWGNRWSQNKLDDPVEWVLDQLELQGVWTRPEKREWGFQ